VLLALGGAVPVWAEDEAPDALIKRLSVEVLDAIKADKTIRAGDMAKVIALVDARILPNLNFQRMTASAVGPGWRQATPEQQKRLQDEFKTLLVRTYAGALAQVTDQSISLKPLRAGADDKEVVVRSEIKGSGDPIQLDYRLEKPGPGGGLEDLQHQCAGCLAGGELQEPICRRNQRQGPGRSDCVPGGTQQNNASSKK